MNEAERAIREALAAGPTPGRWQKATDWNRAAVMQSTEPYTRVVCTGNQNNDDRFGAEDWSGATWVDADYIAACSPENIAALLAEIDRLTSERDEARAERDAMRILVESTCHALHRAGVTSANAPDDPGEAIDIIAAERDALRAENHNLNWALGTEGYEQMATPEEQSEHEEAVHRTDEILGRLAVAKAEHDAKDKDAKRYRLVRRGQHWSVINGIGDQLRADALDAAIDARIEQERSEQGEG